MPDLSLTRKDQKFLRDDHISSEMYPPSLRGRRSVAPSFCAICQGPADAPVCGSCSGKIEDRLRSLTGVEIENAGLRMDVARWRRLALSGWGCAFGIVALLAGAAVFLRWLL